MEGFSNMANCIEVLDSLPGTGKTTAIIQWMHDNKHKKFIVVSPTLSEVEQRFPDNCAELGLVYPTRTGKKSEELLEFLQEGRNIVCTHALFTELKKDHLDLIEIQGYILICDEELGWIEPYTEYTKDDLQFLIENKHIKIHYDDFGRVEFLTDTRLDSKYSKLSRLCALKMVFATKEGMDSFTTQLPMTLLQVMQRVILLTYGYDGSVMQRFLEMKGIGFKYFNEVTLMKSENEVKAKLCNLVTFVDTPSSKKLSNWNLSSTWFSTATEERRKTLIKTMRSLKVQMKSNSDSLMYCVKKSFVPKLDSKAFSEDSFVYASCRATNDYRHKDCLIHAYSRYPHAVILSYLSGYGCEVKSNNFALYELIQWVFRSSIREDKPIKIGFVGKRMELLLKEWLISQG